MFLKIKEEFTNIIEENVSFFNNQNYYFYKDLSCKEIFGISKNIKKDTLFFLKKHFIQIKENLNKEEQMLFDYFFNNKEYPYNKQMSLIMFYIEEKDEEIVMQMLSEIYPQTIVLKYLDHYVALSEEFDNIKELFQLYTLDFLYDTYLHEGLILHNEIKGSEVLEYLKHAIVIKEEHSNVSDVIINVNNQNLNLIKILAKSLLKNLNDNTKELIQAFLKNNLNISQTAKRIYLHRNSLMNKIEQIKKLTHLNIQNFNDAFAMKVLLDAKLHD